MSEHAKRKNARKLLSRAGYKAGGHIKGDKAQDAAMVKKGVRQHEEHDHKGEKPTKLKLKDGGFARGGAPKVRADRKGRGGKKPHVAVNILNAPGGGGGGPPHMAMPPRPPMAPPGPPPGAMAGPPGMPPGGPPPGIKRGGRARHRKGGRTKESYPLDAGSGSGEGRLEKTKAEAKREGGKR